MGPAWSKLSGNNPQQDPGQRAELVLVQTMVGGTVMPTVERLGEEDRLRRLRAVAGSSSSSSSLLTPDEEAVFNKFNYLGYTEGLLATCTVFGVLFGGFRLSAYRTALRQRVLPSSAQAHAHSAAHRRKYAALDASSSKNKSASGSAGSAPSPAAAPDTDFPIFSSDMWSQLQLLLSTCLALWLGTATANLTMDRTRFYRDLAALPQKPGKSALCSRLCPALVEQRRQLLALDSLQPLHEEYLREQRQQQALSEEKDLSEKTEAAAASSSNHDNESSNNTEMTTSTSTTTAIETSSSEFAQAVRRQKPATLWSFPATEELEAVTRLVHNCQRRLDFENECRRRNNHRVDPATNLVDVPEPGVPERYVRLEDDDDDDE